MQEAKTTLYEVIASPKAGNGHAYGLTFTSEATATEYAAAMNRAGYAAEVSPAFETEPTLQAALDNAAEYFRDERLRQAPAAVS